jgi:hypothetical protein
MEKTFTTCYADTRANCTKILQDFLNVGSDGYGNLKKVSRKKISEIVEAIRISLDGKNPQIQQYDPEFQLLIFFLIKFYDKNDFKQEDLNYLQNLAQFEEKAEE